MALTFKETIIKDKNNKHIINVILETTLPIINKKCFIFIKREGIQPIDIGDNAIIETVLFLPTVDNNNNDLNYNIVMNDRIKIMSKDSLKKDFGKLCYVQENPFLYFPSNIYDQSNNNKLINYRMTNYYINGKTWKTAFNNAKTQLCAELQKIADILTTRDKLIKDAEDYDNTI